MEHAVADGYGQVCVFNDIAGVFKGNMEDKIALYISLVKEEIEETKAAFTNKDSVELLDGAADVFVTCMGLLQVMQHAGFDVDKAIARVCANNMEKFPSKHVESNMPKNCIAEYLEEDMLYVYRDKDTGKVKKPINHRKVYLNDLVPQAFWKQ